MAENQDFQQQLQGMADDAARRSRLRTAADIRRRAGRRRTAQVAGAALATVLVMAGAWAVAAPGGDDAGVGPAGPSRGTPTTPEVSSATETSPATDPSEPAESSGPDLPPQETGPTGGPAPSALPADEAPAGGWVTTLPEDPRIVLPHFGQPATSEEESGWTSVETTDSWLILPCDADEATGYPSDKARTAHLAIIQTGIEHAQAEQVAVYPSDVVAMQAMGELRQALMDCQDERTVTRGETEFERTYTDSYWGWRDAADVTRAGDDEPDEALQAWNWNHTYLWDGSPQYGLGGGYFTIARVGNAIALTMSDGETDWAAPEAAQDGSVIEAKTIRAVVPALCERYSGAGGC